MRLLVGEGVDLAAGAVGSECAVLPADRREVGDRRVLVRDGGRQIEEGAELGHARILGLPGA